MRSYYFILCGSFADETTSWVSFYVVLSMKYIEDFHAKSVASRI